MYKNVVYVRRACMTRKEKSSSRLCKKRLGRLMRSRNVMVDKAKANIIGTASKSQVAIISQHSFIASLGWALLGNIFNARPHRRRARDPNQQHMVSDIINSNNNNRPWLLPLRFRTKADCMQVWCRILKIIAFMGLDLLSPPAHVDVLER